MKTLNELYDEVIASDELKNEFLALKTPEDVVAFAKKYGCDAALDDIKAFFEAKQKEAGELSDADLEQVAGGKSANPVEGALSFFTLGLACAGTVLYSVFTGKVGTAIEGEGMLCAAPGKKNSGSTFARG